MNARMMEEVRRWVAAGSIPKGDGFIWVCPICCARVATGPDLIVISRAALSHCLIHTDSLDAARRARNAARPAGARAKASLAQR